MNMFVRYAPLVYAFLLRCQKSDALTAESCHCRVPTPCWNRDEAKCLRPSVDDIKKCPKHTRDCRTIGRLDVCGANDKAHEGFCCWTACSSLAMKRVCSSPPHGFTFDKTGVSNGTECHDFLNTREQCCLRELKTKGDRQAKSPHCPSDGHTMAKLFESVDGSRSSAPDSVMSADELLESIKWLQRHQYLFVIDNFDAIDADHNRDISWYELEYYCGMVGLTLPPTDIWQIRSTSEFDHILLSPVCWYAIVVSLVAGEFVCIWSEWTNRLCGNRLGEGLVFQILWVLLGQMWPLAYAILQWYYFFAKIEWELCSSFKGVKNTFMIVIILYSFMVAIVLGTWIRRKMPIGPIVDIQRRVFLMRVFYRRSGRVFRILCQIATVVTALLGFGYAALVGTLPIHLLHGHVEGIIDVDGMQECEREDPDLALLYAANEKLFLWKVFSVSFLQIYINVFPEFVSRNNQQDQDSNLYAQVSPEESVLPPEDSNFPRICSSDVSQTQEKVTKLEREQRDKWQWFARQ